MLTLVFATVRPLLAGERAMANGLLGADIPPPRLAPAGEGWLGRFKAYWTDGATWRGIAYLLARFPIGTATFTVAVATYASALFLIAGPIVAPFDAIELGSGAPGQVSTASRSCRCGLVLLLAAGWISEGMARRALARWGRALRAPAQAATGWPACPDRHSAQPCAA